MRTVVTLLALSSLASGCAAFVQRPGTPLAEAALAGDAGAITRLIAAGADPNAFDASGQAPLHWAARGGHRPGPHECRGEAASRPDIVSLLIDLGADVNARDRRPTFPGASSGWTPLHVALHHEQFHTAARLLERGASPNIRSRQGRSVMAMAADEGAPPALLHAMLAQGFDPRR